jgi:hypothetical protein
MPIVGSMFQKSGFSAWGTTLTYDEPDPRVFSAHTAAALVKGNKGMRKIAVELGVATGTVQRVKAEMEARPA